MRSEPQKNIKDLLCLVLSLFLLGEEMFVEIDHEVENVYPASDICTSWLAKET